MGLFGHMGGCVFVLECIVQRDVSIILSIPLTTVRPG